MTHLKGYFDIAGSIFYSAVREYYTMISEECNYDKAKVCNEYKERYTMFLGQLLRFLMEYNLYTSLVTQSEFKIYSNIFRVKNQQDMKHLQQHINELSFLVNKQDKPYYIEAVQSYIRKTDI